MRRSIRKRLRTSEPTKSPHGFAAQDSTPARRRTDGRRQGNAVFAALLSATTSAAFILPPQPTSPGEPIPLEDSPANRPGRRPRPPSRPERQQILIRRGLALGGGL